jgi:hypothetical protein
MANIKKVQIIVGNKKILTEIELTEQEYKKINGEMEFILLISTKEIYKKLKISNTGREGRTKHITLPKEFRDKIKIDDKHKNLFVNEYRGKLYLTYEFELKKIKSGVIGNE